MRGSYSEALQLLDETLPDSLAHSEVAVRQKLVRGLVHSFSQQFDEADHDLSDAEGLASVYQPALLGDVFQARGNLEVDRRRFPQASTAFRSALAIARAQKLPFLEASALGNLGNVAMWEEHYDEAIEWFKSALDKSKSAGAASTVAKTLGNMGWNYSAIGDFENAEPLLQAAQEESRKAGLVGDRIYWLNTLGGVFYQEHRYGEAQIASQQALSLARGQDDKGTLTACLNTMSEIALATGHFEEAEKLNREAAEIERAGLDYLGIQYSKLIAARIAASRKNYSAATIIFEALIADANVDSAVKWEAHARLAQIDSAIAKPSNANHEFDLAIRAIQSARGSVQRDEFRMSFLSTAISFYDAYVSFLIDQHRSLDALRIADLSRAQTLEEGLSSIATNEPAKSAFNPQSIARRLNATLLFYWLGEGRSYLWVISSAKTSTITLPASAAIDSSVKSYRQSFLEPRDPLEAGNSDGKKLYDALIAPAEKLIPKNSRVVVLPDGSLNSLNFETLIVSQPQPHYWIEDVTISTANSLALLSRSSLAMPPKEDRLLMVGDALPASSDFPPLPQAGKEIGLLENYFASSHRLELTGANATATRFLSSQPEKFTYLHFATHGTASRLRPLESAVILSPEGESYKLYARDVVKHPLTAYLVTISACNGAGTKSYAGEGLVGLSWAFLRAGAHNVIAGLWEVSNASTPQLMDELYKGIHAGQDPATALRNAKLTLVHSNGNYRKPFYWAPFLLYSGS
jgi:CHAT domain-containing protein